MPGPKWKPSNDVTVTLIGDSAAKPHRAMTACSGAPPDGQSPMFETTLLETLAIRKFLEMSVADIRDQLERAARDGTPRKLFLAQKQNGYVITAWLTGALMTVDGMLAAAAARSTKTLAEELLKEAS